MIRPPIKNIGGGEAVTFKLPAKVLRNPILRNHSCPPNPVNREWFETRSSIASLKSEKAVYLQGASSIQISLLTSSPCLRLGCAIPVAGDQRRPVGNRFLKGH